MRSSAEFRAESTLRRLGYDVRGLTKQEILEHYYALLPDHVWDRIKGEAEIAQADAAARADGFEDWMVAAAAAEIERVERQAEERMRLQERLAGHQEQQG